MTVDMASCPAVGSRRPPREAAVSTGGGPPLSGWHFLPRRPGTFAQYVRNVGRRAERAALGLLKWPFALRPYLESSNRWPRSAARARAPAREAPPAGEGGSEGETKGEHSAEGGRRGRKTGREPQIVVHVKFQHRL